MAAAALGRPPFTLADLVGELAWPDGTDVVLVETAGGVRSPLAGDGDAVDLAAALRPARTLLVADPGLGTINAVRLSIGALADHRPVVHLNRYDDGDPLHRGNAAWLREHDGLRCETTVAGLTGTVTGAAGPSHD
jgi:dethiobiotin synthetase